MAMLVGLTGLPLENESAGAKYSFVKVGWGAIMCACFYVHGSWSRKVFYFRLFYAF